MRDYVDTAAFLAERSPEQLLTMARRVDPGIEDEEVIDPRARRSGRCGFVGRYARRNRCPDGKVYRPAAVPGEPAGPAVARHPDRLRRNDSASAAVGPPYPQAEGEEYAIGRDGSPYWALLDILSTRVGGPPHPSFGYDR